MTSQAQVPSAGRWVTFAHAVAFVLGFSAVFIGVFGTAVTIIGDWLYGLRIWLAFIGGIVVVIFGLTTAGWLRIQFLEYDIRYQSGVRRDLGYISSFLMGVFFSAGWVPCVGPTLAAVITLAANQNTAGQGVFLLVGYSLGLGIPFLATGLAVDRMTTLLRRARRYMPAIKMVTAALLIIIGLMLLVDSLPRVVSEVAEWTGADWTLSFPSWMPSLQGLSRLASAAQTQEAIERLAGVADGSPQVAVTPTFFVAFLAGLLSFLSPCVLPLVPAYIGYLSGRAVQQAAGPQDR